MQNAIKWGGYVLLLLLLIGVCWLGYVASQIFVEASDNVKLGIITAVVSISALVYNNARQQTREIKSRQFSEKKEAYQNFFNFMFEIFCAQRKSREISELETIERMHSIVKDLMVWGSADTINQFNSFIRASSNPNVEIKDTFHHIENLMISFRKDLGHNDRGLEVFGLSKLLLKGDEHRKLDTGDFS